MPADKYEAVIQEQVNFSPAVTVSTLQQNQLVLLKEQQLLAGSLQVHGSVPWGSRAAWISCSDSSHIHLKLSASSNSILALTPSNEKTTKKPQKTPQKAASLHCSHQVPAKRQMALGWLSSAQSLLGVLPWEWFVTVLPPIYSSAKETSTSWGSVLWESSQQPLHFPGRLIPVKATGFHSLVSRKKKKNNPPFSPLLLLLSSNIVTVLLALLCLCEGA